MLIELDTFINYCERNGVPDRTITKINIKTHNYIKQCKKQKMPKHVSMTKMFLRKLELIAVPFDKDIGFCVMPRTAYEHKLQPILNLEQFGKHTDSKENSKNHIIKEEELITEKLKQLKKENKISEGIFNKMKPLGSQPQWSYGLAKVHKKDCPMRPVVSMQGSPYHNIVKTVATWLTYIPECNINYNTKMVSDDLKNCNLDDNEQIISFEIVPLYTKVPVREAIECCTNIFSGTKELKVLTKIPLKYYLD